MLTQLKFTHLKSKRSGATVEQYVKLGEMRSLVWEDDSFGFCQDFTPTWINLYSEIYSAIYSAIWAHKVFDLFNSVKKWNS